MVYIMSLKLYKQLRNVWGFVDCNGGSYGEHVADVCKDLLSLEQREVIRGMVDEDVLGELVCLGVAYSHDMK